MNPKTIIINLIAISDSKEFSILLDEGGQKAYGNLILTFAKEVDIENHKIICDSLCQNTPELRSKIAKYVDLYKAKNPVVAKAPLNKDNVLYRFCKTTDKDNMKEEDVITFSYNLTCTNFDWKQEKDGNVYVITPLTGGKTKAHNLFEIWEHGDEKQVDFLRGSTFKVTKVETIPGTEYHKYYLQEI